MLGRHISDPEQVEAAGVTEIDGMGLLPLETVFQGEKVQTQTNGVFSGVAGLLSELNGKHYAGYEIHMGCSEEARGALFSMGNVYGSYVHGIFDEQEVAGTILKALCTKRAFPLNRSAALTRKPTRSGSMICWQTRCARGSICRSSTAF